jgi:hypothetical protein
MGFDPRGILAAFERHYVELVVIGGLARVIRGTDELTDGLDVCPSVRREENVVQLGLALDELGATRVDGKPLAVDADSLRDDRVLDLRTRLGEVRVVAEPAGTRRGYIDLRRDATREHIGHGLRPYVASVADLARMAAALGREQDIERLGELRRIMEIEPVLHRRFGIELDRGLERGIDF